jgi:phosphopantetheine--protein transferase-like protein
MKIDTKPIKMENNKDIQIECLSLTEIQPTDIISKYINSKIKVYYFEPGNFYSLLDYFYKVLSKEEKSKAASFHFIEFSYRFVICHGILRMLLSEKLSCEPESLVFHKGINGKPYLEGNKLFFNLSHTKDLCAIAISDNRDVGIDIEKINDTTDYKGISECFCSEDEQQLIKASQNPMEYFFLFWTRKEAFLKAIGLGLNTTLQEINVCQSVNLTKYSSLCKNQEMEIGENYFIYSDQIKDHFLSVATSAEANIELNYIPFWTKTKSSKNQQSFTLSN